MSFPLSNLGSKLTILGIANQHKSNYNLAIKYKCKTYCQKGNGNMLDQIKQEINKALTEITDLELLDLILKLLICENG